MTASCYFNLLWVLSLLREIFLRDLHFPFSLANTSKVSILLCTNSRRLKVCRCLWGGTKYIFNVLASIYLFFAMSWLATENFSCQWLQNKHFPIPVLLGTQELSLSEVFRALDIFRGVDNVHFYCLYVYLFDYRDLVIAWRRDVPWEWLDHAWRFSVFPFFK